VDRRDFQVLSRLRLKEARVLLAARLYDGAYYLAGYAVECALKACIAKATRRHEFPDRVRVNGSYTHNLKELVVFADLENALRRDLTNPDFSQKWEAVRSWSEGSRYDRIDAQKARALVRAVGNRGDGVLSWLRRYW
jgi:HEPN domain-containing protein